MAVIGDYRPEPPNGSVVLVGEDRVPFQRRGIAHNDFWYGFRGAKTFETLMRTYTPVILIYVPSEVK